MATPPFDVTVRGVPLENRGLTEWQTVDGLGLLTDGLIWSCYSIWYGPIVSTGATMVNTSWSLMPMVMTGWSLMPPVSTAWSPYSTNNIENC